MSVEDGGDAPMSVIVDTVLDNPDPTDGGAVTAHVSHGPFWQPAAIFSSSFFWDAYLAPRTGGTLVSDGYGSNHEFLWQATPSLDGSQLIFQGSVFDGVNKPFTAAEGPAPGEWGYHAVMLTNEPTLAAPYVFTYWNGVAVGMSVFGGGQRGSVPPNGHGEGNLYVMGSTAGHTLGGRIAALRGWDNSTPFGMDNPGWAFIPERTFSQETGTVPVDLLIDYTVSGVQVPDLAPLGYAGGGAGPARLHPGILMNAPEDQLSLKTGPGPHWVSDVLSPYGKVGVLTNTNERTQIKGSAPAMALVFDSFARTSQTFAFQSLPSLGKTEGGSLGALVWNTGIFRPPLLPAVFGILNGRAVFLEHQPGLAWVDCGTADQDIRLTRLIGNGQIGTTGIAMRVKDRLNWWYAILLGVPSGLAAHLRVGYFLNTTETEVTNFSSPATGWTTLRVRALGSTLTFFVDDRMGGWTTLGSVTNTTLQTGTGVGLAGAVRFNEATSLWRGDDFTVCPAGTGC